MRTIKKQSKKVTIGMSGGVDSSLAAALLKEQGYDVIGIFMHFWSDPVISPEVKASNKCCSLESFEDARRTAQQLGIPFYTLNFDEAFKKEIVDDFIRTYENGKTPNPCVRCNKYVKFGLFWEKAKALGCDYIAMGHYARITIDTQGIAHLYEGVDTDKDQSYFLYKVPQEILRHVLLPLGEYTKPTVRAMAKERNILVHNKKDSQEICFVGDVEHYPFLKRHAKLTVGDIVDTNGNILGKHEGLPAYTVGQRKGLDLQKGDGPYFVVALDVEKNQVIVTNDPSHPALFGDIIEIEDVHWVSAEPSYPFDAEVRIRYRHRGNSARITSLSSGNLQVTFKEKQRALTPGQSAVFYRDDGEVIGGGVIV